MGDDDREYNRSSGGTGTGNLSRKRPRSGNSYKGRATSRSRDTDKDQHRTRDRDRRGREHHRRSDDRRNDTSRRSEKRRERKQGRSINRYRKRERHYDYDRGRYRGKASYTNRDRRPNYRIWHNRDNRYRSREYEYNSTSRRRHGRNRDSRRTGPRSRRLSRSRSRRRSYNSSSRSERDSKSKSGSESTRDDTVGEYKGNNGDMINDRYLIFNELGVGTFGRVLACVDQGDPQGQAIVAVKVVRAVARYTKSARVEAEFLELVNNSFDAEVAKNPDSRLVKDSYFLQMLAHFEWQKHYCIVTETLGLSLYNIVKANNYCGFTLKTVLSITHQMLLGLQFMEEICQLVHTDLKLENVLLVDDKEVVKILQNAKATKEYKRIEVSGLRVKLIDFGGACRLKTDESRRTSVINTRQYRSPEVTLQTGWSFPSDIWSCGCISVELLRGDLLFQTHEELEHLALIQKITTSTFPRSLVEKSPRKRDFFRSDCGLRWPENAEDRASRKHVQDANTLEQLVMKDKGSDSSHKLNDYLSLMKGLLKIDPKKRYSAREAVDLILKLLY